jgi:hypothetical protein
MAQLHKKFTDAQVKEMLQRYLHNEIERPYVQQILGIGKTRFFALLKSAALRVRSWILLFGL